MSTLHPHIEDAQILSVSAVIKVHLSGRCDFLLDVRPPAAAYAVHFFLRLEESTGVVDLRYEVQIDGSWDIGRMTIYLEATRLSFGGRRWWFVCPLTGKRAAKLYLFPNQMYFCHRTGIDPAPSYLSQRVPKGQRIYQRMHALRQRLHEQGTILETLRRPRGMHLKTYVRLIQRDAALWNSPENRVMALYKKCNAGASEKRGLPNYLGATRRHKSTQPKDP
jgi:hypothetical protein